MMMTFKSLAGDEDDQAAAATGARFALNMMKFSF